MEEKRSCQDLGKDRYLGIRIRIDDTKPGDVGPSLYQSIVRDET